MSTEAQAEGVSPANAISLESVAEWTRMLQKLIKGKSRLRQEVSLMRSRISRWPVGSPRDVQYLMVLSQELTAIRQLMDTIEESWMTKKLRFSLVKVGSRDAHHSLEP